MDKISGQHTALAMNPNRPVVSMRSLYDEAQGQEKKVFDLGNGMSIERQGAMFSFTGSGIDNLSPGAFLAALQASEMGGDAGRSMFNTYAKTHKEDFDGSNTLSSIVARGQNIRTADDVKAGASHASANGVDDENSDGKIEGTATDDILEFFDKARLWGLGGNDILSGYNSSTLFGGDGNDTLSAYNNSVLHGGNGNDQLSAYAWSTLYGDAGNDRLSAYSHSALYGGDGDDVLSAYGSSTFYGGAGNDKLSGYSNTFFDGGAGDDDMHGYNNVTVHDMSGDNSVDVYRNANITTGSGNDWIETYDDATINAGDGNNMVTTYGGASVVTGSGEDYIHVGANSHVSSGAGDDLIQADVNATVISGDGDDIITTSYGATIIGGKGNDYIRTSDATIHFSQGDGHDVVWGGHSGNFEDRAAVSSNTIAFGEGITASDISFQVEGNNLLVIVKGGQDSITLRDVSFNGVPNMTFADGSVINANDVSKAVGELAPSDHRIQLGVRWSTVQKAYKDGEL